MFKRNFIDICWDLNYIVERKWGGSKNKRRGSKRRKNFLKNGISDKGGKELNTRY